MGKTVHFVPVGFDYERLIIPILQDQLDADRVVILRSGEAEFDQDDDIGPELVGKMTEKVQEFTDLKGLEVETNKVEDIYQYEEVYKNAYGMMKEYIDDGWEVYVNISSMPRTVAFAFATASNSFFVEEAELRDQVHTYYVAPEKYLVTDMIRELRELRDLLEQLLENPHKASIEQRLEDVENLLSNVENKGITEGARDLDHEDQEKYVEFPPSPLSGLRDFEKTLMRELNELENARSISQLAQNIAQRQGVEFNESFRSKVQYNINSLDDKGYVVLSEQGNRHETQLSTMGGLWVETHLTDDSGSEGQQTIRAD